MGEKGWAVYGLPGVKDVALVIIKMK